MVLEKISSGNVPLDFNAQFSFFIIYLLLLRWSTDKKKVILTYNKLVNFLCLFFFYQSIVIPIMYFLVLYTAKWIRDRSTFNSIKPKLDFRLFVHFCVSPCSYLFWAENCFEDQNKIILCSKRVRMGKKTQKSSNNRMSSFGLIEDNIELSHIY